MKFTIDGSLLSTVISELHKVCASRSVIPILSGIKIEASNEGLKLTGGNSELFIETTIPTNTDSLKVLEGGSVVIQSKYFSELLKKLPAKVHIQSGSNNEIVIKSGEIVTKIPGFDANEYPKLPDVNSQQIVKLRLGILKDTIKQTLFAVAKNDAKPVLEGVRIELAKGKLICVATDSNRLARCEVNVSSDLTEAIVVPKASLLEVLSSKENDNTIIEITLGNRFLTMKIGSTKMISALIEGNYPNTETLIPTAYISTITMNRKNLLAGIERACIFSGALKHNNVHLKLSENGSMKIASSSTEIGMIEESQKIVEMQGNDFDITLDGKYLAEAIKAIHEEDVTFQYNGSMRPILIRPAQSRSYVQLISPRRTH